MIALSHHFAANWIIKVAPEMLRKMEH